MSEKDKETIQMMKDLACFDLLVESLRALRTAKPDDRSEKARQYAVTITEMEKTLAYFHTYIVSDETRK